MKFERRLTTNPNDKTQQTCWNIFLPAMIITRTKQLKKFSATCKDRMFLHNASNDSLLKNLLSKAWPNMSKSKEKLFFINNWIFTRISGLHHADLLITEQCTCDFIEFKPKMSLFFQECRRPKCDFNKVAFGMGFLLWICSIFSEHVFIRVPMEGCFWEWKQVAVIRLPGNLSI